MNITYPRTPLTWYQQLARAVKVGAMVAIAVTLVRAAYLIWFVL